MIPDRVPALAMPTLDTGSLPSSLQSIGPWWSERRLLQIGRELERAEMVGFRPPPIW